MGGSPNRIATFQRTMELRVGLEPTTCALLVEMIGLAPIFRFSTLSYIPKCAALPIEPTKQNASLSLAGWEAFHPPTGPQTLYRYSGRGGGI